MHAAQRAQLSLSFHSALAVGMELGMCILRAPEGRWPEHRNESSVQQQNIICEAQSAKIVENEGRELGKKVILIC